VTVAYFGTGATLGVYIDFDAGVTDTPAAWTDVTADVVIDSPLTINRGRSSERDTFQTGTIGLTLLNAGRKYDPEYSAGPYFGKLLPGRHIKVELTYSASTSVLARGFIQGWPQSWETSDNKSVVSIVAHDAFKYLALAQLPDSRYAVEVLADAPSAWYRLGDADDEEVCLDSSGNARNGKYLDDTTLRGTLTTGLVELSPNGARTMTGTSDTSKQLIATDLHYLSGTSFSWEAWLTVPEDLNTSLYNDVPLHVWSQSSGVLAFAPIVAFTVEPVLTAPSIRMRFYRTTTDVVYFGVQIADGTNTYEDRWNLYNKVIDGSRHHLVVTRNGATLKLYVDGVELARTTTTGTLTGASSTFGTNVWLGNLHRGTWIVDEVALYTTELASGDVTAHYNAGSTADSGNDVDGRIAQTLTDAGITWLASSLEDSLVTVRGADYSNGLVLGYFQSLEATEQGRVFIAADGTLTFHNNGHDIGASVAAAFTDVAGGSLPYVECDHEFDDTRVINDATVSRANGVPQRTTDATSRAEYGLRSTTVDGLQAQLDGYAKSVADYLVTRYKDPAARIRALRVAPRANAAGLFPIVRTLDVGSKVTVRRLPLGVGSAFTKTLMVEGVSHSIGVDGEWVTTYLTSPADASGVGRWDEGLWDQAKWGL
jgi:hypothetical protein